MPEAYTRDGYYVETSADVVTATRIARAVPGREPDEAYASDRRVGFGQPDYNASLLVPIWFTCRAVLDFGSRRTAARAVTWALRRRGHHARRRYAAPIKFWVQ